jgi:hypothetical protein
MSDSHPSPGVASHLAPTDLAAARRRVRRLADERCRRLGVDTAAAGAVVELERRPLAGQAHRITADTAVVVADFVLWRWDQPDLDGLGGLLGPEAALVFVEPTADLGWRRALHRVGRLPARLLLRHNFERDIPARLRQAGLIVGTVDRFSLGPAGVGSYVWGQAEHIYPEQPVQAARPTRPAQPLR